MTEAATISSELPGDACPWNGILENDDMALSKPTPKWISDLGEGIVVFWAAKCEEFVGNHHGEMKNHAT